MATSAKNTSNEEAANAISLAEFLESHPPNQLIRVDKCCGYRDGVDGLRILTPEIRLHCSKDSCNGARFFRCITSPPQVEEGQFVYAFLTYRCWNCQRSDKIFALAIKQDKHATQSLTTGEAMKIGEAPPFGPPTSSRLISLIGPDRDAFLKGRRCENQGLGIGAFVYYRRVVENQKARILEEIIKVAEKVGTNPKMVETLKEAAKEVQFSRAIEMAKAALPESLLVNGHNPLALLHSALSEGVHELSDEECLTIASSVRVVLGELSDRLAQALKDEDELKEALSTLLNRKKK